MRCSKIIDNILIDKFIGHVRDTRTIGMSYCSHIKRTVRNLLLCLACRGIPIDEVTQVHLQRYLSFQKERGVKAHNINADIGILRSWFQYLLEQGVIKTNPMYEVYCSWLVRKDGGYFSYHGSLRKIFTHPATVRKYLTKYFNPYLEEYIDYLLERGYKRARIYRVILHSYHFSEYLRKTGITNIRDISYEHYRGYIQVQCRNYESIHGCSMSDDRLNELQGCLKGLLNYLHRRMNIRFQEPSDEKILRVIPKKWLKIYLDFRKIHRGVGEFTLARDRYWLNLLDEFLCQKRIKMLNNVTILDLDEFVLKYARCMNKKTICILNGVLRHFFGYLFMADYIKVNFAEKIMSPRMFSQALLPKYISWDKIRFTIENIDRTAVAGKRDYAIMLLFAYYGLRAREIRKLKLQDIDWEQDKLYIRARKNDTNAIYPLKKEVRNAILDYLKNERPRGTALEEIFLRSNAPVKPLAKTSSIPAIARRHLKNSHLMLPQYGSNVLRHSFAKYMLDMGAPMPVIGDILGHKSLNSTMVYTRVSIEDMREITDNYANLI